MGKEIDGGVSSRELSLVKFDMHIGINAVSVFLGSFHVYLLIACISDVLPTSQMKLLIFKNRILTSE